MTNVFHITGALWGEHPVTGGFRQKANNDWDFLLLFTTSFSTNSPVARDLSRYDAHVTSL